MDAYIAQLNEMDLIALRIARETLGTLFDLEKSRDYIRWLELGKQAENKRVATDATAP
jgi:hypothetical protein